VLAFLLLLSDASSVGGGDEGDGGCDCGGELHDDDVAGLLWWLLGD